MSGCTCCLSGPEHQAEPQHGGAVDLLLRVLAQQCPLPAPGLLEASPVPDVGWCCPLGEQASEGLWRNKAEGR